MNFPDYIGPFIKRKEEPNAISFGALYSLQIEVDVPNERNRFLRVYLPEDYDPNKKYPVMYMCDAQNAVDRYLTAYGEWDIDEHMHELIREGYPSFLVVGLDCPKNPINRISEYVLDDATYYLLNKKGKKKGYGKRYASFLINYVKPLIEKHFSVYPDKNHTAFGGSSMGGLCSFDIVSTYSDIFSFSLCFSPSFKFFNQKEYYAELSKRKFDINNQKFYFYCGALDLDKNLLGGTIKMYKYLRSLGYDDDHIALNIDNFATHNEEAWSKHFNEAIKFWLNKKSEE